MIDRLTIRNRPAGSPIMHQRWDKLLFLHWRVPADAIRPLVPPRLELDTFEEHTWISISPFSMSGIRPNLLPAVPVLSDSLELNVRTYVHADGVPGVWFLSLEASNPLAVWGARAGFHLPYFRAEMHMWDDAGSSRFTSHRTHVNAPAADFDAAWVRGDPPRQAEPGTLDFFLTERYCLYAADDDRILRVRIHHAPWLLSSATLLHLRSTMLESHGLPTPSHAPLLHAQRATLDVEVWSPETV